MIVRRTMNQARRQLYAMARVLGDLNALSRGPAALGRRFLRKQLHRRAGAFINRLIKP